MGEQIDISNSPEVLRARLREIDATRKSINDTIADCKAKIDEYLDQINECKVLTEDTRREEGIYRLNIAHQGEAIARLELNLLECDLASEQLNKLIRRDDRARRQQ